MRELVQACDKLMEDLKIRVDRLKGIYERSDAMLANYPGGKYRHNLLYVPLKFSFDLSNHNIQASFLFISAPHTLCAWNVIQTVTPINRFPLLFSKYYFILFF